MFQRLSAFARDVRQANAGAYANLARAEFAWVTRRRFPHAWPAAVDVVLTRACNLRCRFCVSYGSLAAARSMPIERLERIAREVFPHACGVFFCSGGEPFLYPHIRRAAALARAARTYVTVTTNGTRVGPEEAAWLVSDASVNALVFSVDAALPGTLASIRRGADLDTVFANIEGLSAMKRQARARYPEVRIRFVAMRSNIAELPALIEACPRLGVTEVEVKHLDVCNDIDARESVLGDPGSAAALERAGRTAAACGVALRLPRARVRRGRCSAPWLFCMFDTDGSVRFCYHAWRQRLGVFDDGFAAVWRGPHYGRLRESVDSATPYYPFCLYCPEHLGNDSPEAHNLRLHPESYVIPGLERWQVPFAERRADAAPAEAPPV